MSLSLLGISLLGFLEVLKIDIFSLHRRSGYGKYTKEKERKKIHDLATDCDESFCIAPKDGVDGDGLQA